MFNNIRVSSTYAFYANPLVSHSTNDVKEGDSFITYGFQITSDHQFLIVQPFERMACTVMFKENHLPGKIKFGNLFRRHHIRYTDIKKRTLLSLEAVDHVDFNDGYDDSCHSFQSITAAEVVVHNNRTRRIYYEHQITSPDQLVRGKVIIHHYYRTGKNLAIARKMVLLSGPEFDGDFPHQIVKGLYLNPDGTTGEFWPFLETNTVIPSEKGYWNNLSYFVDTGQTMTEEEIQQALSKKKNPTKE